MACSSFLKSTSPHFFILLGDKGKADSVLYPRKSSSLNRFDAFLNKEIIWSSGNPVWDLPPKGIHSIRYEKHVPALPERVVFL